MNGLAELRRRRQTSGAGKKPKRKRVNQAGRPTAAELERRKARVMEVATELFVSHGYAATSLVDIAKGAGVATRTLYQHFGDKEAMFREVIFARDMRSTVPRPELQAGDTLFTALNRAAHYACDVALRERSIDLMRLMIAEANRFPELMNDVATAIFTRFQGNIAQYFANLAEAGIMPDGDHARSAELFLDLILGSRPIMIYMHWLASLPDDADLEERVQLFISGRFGADVAQKARTRQAKAK